MNRGEWRNSSRPGGPVTSCRELGCWKLLDFLGFFGVFFLVLFKCRSRPRTPDSWLSEADSGSISSPVVTCISRAVGPHIRRLNYLSGLPLWQMASVSSNVIFASTCDGLSAVSLSADCFIVLAAVIPQPAVKCWTVWVFPSVCLLSHCFRHPPSSSLHPELFLLLPCQPPSLPSTPHSSLFPPFFSVSSPHFSAVSPLQMLAVSAPWAASPWWAPLGIQSTILAFSSKQLLFFFLQ